MEYKYQVDTNIKALNCQIISAKKLSTYESDNVDVYIDGDVMIDDISAQAQQVVDKYIALNSSIETLYQQLSGQFWLLIVDKVQDKVVLLNDHFAMKPCYWGLFDKNLYISNSLKAMKKAKEIPLTISDQAIFNYMYFHCIPSPNTIYTEIAKLEPSKSVSFDSNGKVATQDLYCPSFNKKKEINKDKYQECLDVVDKAVDKNITEDCGAFLSGGLDSSTVVGMLARHQSKPKTFSIGFDVKAYDETEYAKLTAKHFGSKHEVLFLQPEQAAEEFVRVAQYFDEPFGNSSAMATYFCAKFAKEHGVSTLLAGDGGDELFAGNERYAKQKIFELYQSVPSFVQGIAKTTLCKTPLKHVPLLKKGASYINQAEVPLPDRFETYNFLNQFGIENMFESDFLGKINSQQPLSLQQERYFNCSSDDIVDKMLYLDWKFTLADNDLVKVGRMCDMAGVDVKYPLLDKSLVDFSCTIPADIKLPGGKLRDFYKKTCTGFLANETLSKSKHGFGLPFGVWMKENQVLKELVLDTLQTFKNRNIVKDSLIDDALAAHSSVHAGYFGELIWIMVVLELWLQQD